MSTRPVVIISGGNTGIGAATSLRLAKRGCSVLVNYIDYESDANSIVERCFAIGVDAISVRGNVANDDDCQMLVDAAIKQWGMLDKLVCCAGTTQYCNLDDLDLQNAEDFQRIYSVNLIGAYQLARAAQPQLSNSQNAAIVMISSIASQNGSGSSLGYICSKGAVNALILSLARLFAPDIRVNAVLPGLVNSNWFPRILGQERFNEIIKDYVSQTALRDICEPDDIAQAVEYLLMDAGKITGQFLTVDAGFGLDSPISYGQ